jgi:hypothetical protein
MGVLKITVCAGVAVVAAALVPTAYASGDGGRDDGGRNGGGSVSVTPSRPSPGSEVTLKVTGCGGRTATAVSAAFVADARLVVVGDGDGALVGDTRVRSTLTAGSYDVRIACADLQVKGRIEVRQPASAPSNGSSAPAAPSALTAPPTPAAPAADLADPDAADAPDAPDAADAPDAFDSSSAPPASPTVSDAPLASPVAPVRAGGGGAAPLASVEGARADGHGPGTVQAVVGLVLAGVTAAVVVFRGLRRRPEAD